MGLGVSFAQEMPHQRYGNDVIYETSAWLEMVESSQDSIDVIYIWTSWCGPCRAQLPELRGLKERYAHLPIRWTMVSFDDKRSAWLRILDMTQTTWRQVWVSPEERKAFSDFFLVVKGYPTKLIVEPRNERGRRKSYSYDRWVKEIERL